MGLRKKNKRSEKHQDKEQEGNYKKRSSNGNFGESLERKKEKLGAMSSVPRISQRMGTVLHSCSCEGAREAQHEAWRSQHASTSALPANAFEPWPFQKASRAVRRRKRTHEVSL